MTFVTEAERELDRRLRRVEKMQSLHQFALQRQDQQLKVLDTASVQGEFGQWRAQLRHLWHQHQLLITKLTVTSEAVWLAEKLLPAEAGQVARMLVWAQQLPDETWQRFGKMPLLDVLAEVKDAYRGEALGMTLPEVLAGLAEAVSGFRVADDDEDVAYSANGSTYSTT